MGNWNGLKSTHPLYRTWQDMKRRCYKKNRPEYKNYGGRGISVCNRWLESFWYFIEDMGNRQDGLELDRIDNNGNYEPVNCKWSTRAEQTKNQRDKRSLQRHIYKHRNSFQVRATIEQKQKYFGCFKTIELAKKRVDYLKYTGVL